MSLSFEYPLYLLLLAVIAAAGLTLLLYHKDKSFDELEKWKIRLMSALRFVFILLILILLLNPILRRTTTIENKPIIAFVQDNSSSILLNKDSVYYQTDYLDEVEWLLTSLSQDYDVRRFIFDEKTKLDSVIDYSGETTNISAVFTEIVSRFSGMNMGAVILATDGIYNQGMNPVYSRNVRYPVYSIALGDTVQQKDIILEDVIHNRIAFLGNKFPVRIHISAEKTEETHTDILISKEDETVYSRQIQIPEDGQSKTINVDLLADKLGLQQYEVFIKPVEGEISIENNRADFVIDVIDNRQKILILGNSPHPDIGALRFALQENPNFELHIRYVYDFNENVSNYDLVILHQLPSVNHNISGLLSEIENNNISVLYIIGTKTSINSFNSIASGLEIISQTKSFDNARPIINNDFKLFEAGENIASLIESVPPLRVYFGDYRVSGDMRVFMYQVINGIRTDKPLIAFIDRFESKTGFITGEGIFRWRLTDFRHFSSHYNFKEFVNKMIQYLATKRLDERLINNYKRIYNENESVIIDAEFYNEAFELVPHQTISLVLTDEEGREYDYFFRDYSNSYRLDLGRLMPGRYSFDASIEFDNVLHNSSGDFIVQQVNIESLKTTANHNILYRLSQNTGGKVFFPNNMNQIPDILQTDDNIVTTATQKHRNLNINDLYPLFFIILLFAATEWFLRKFWGSY